MTTHFITAEIDLKESPAKLQQQIETQLEKEGKPLRWAIAETDKEKATVKVEAIVTKD